MDLELAVWILVFVGGYVVALAFLLRIAMKPRADTDGDTSTPGNAPESTAP